MENVEKINELIIGRVEPHIYAFSTNTIPNYLKVGDTYRPLLVRLNEWRIHFPDLKKEFDAKATISSEVFFRDYAVHDYLEKELGKHRLLIEDMKGFPSGTYYSKEFFQDTTPDEVKEAIYDIKQSYAKNEDKYRFYNANTTLPETHMYASTGYWNPYPKQKEAIRNFMHAVQNGRKNLLMYAVMRFGKSFTSLCCAKEMNAKTILVVSAKADVKEEWKKTVQSADNFNKDYVFLSSDELSNDGDAIKNIIDNGKGVVLFLTLQDLQGKKIKEKHKELFDSEIDIMIIDETHYGARAESYGEIIRTAGYAKDIRLQFNVEDGDDFVEADDMEAQLKSLNVKIKLHLSGTPYRILMGSEFSKEDIISFCQFSDIVEEQDAWDKKNLLDDNVEEWKNPYYGFPKMIRFAFTPSKEALALLDSLKHNGTTYALSELLKPVSIQKKDDGSHKKFLHEKEVLELFEAIDGSREDDSIFAFLDYEKIKEGKMCRHIVCVLPYCASCDALEKLLLENKSIFRNLGDYEIINISGVDAVRMYKTVRSIKEKIKKCEEKDRKTITLTVERMLTGSTVKEWDTMIFLKDTTSPQEYDQAVFRLQSKYIKSYIEKETGREIKYNMKPQTLLVDFDIHRMFIMQEQKSLIHNVNRDTSGNRYLKERMEAELRISPIIIVNKGKIKQVEAMDILSFVSEYSNNRGVKDEAKDIPVDETLFCIDIIKDEIERQAELGTKGGLKTEAYQGKKQNFDVPDNGDMDAAENPSSKNNLETSVGSRIFVEDTENMLQILKNKFKTYYSRILFYAFLTEDKITSLADIIDSADSNDNARIIRNLNLDIGVLKQIQSQINPFILNTLDYKIQNINQLSHDDNIPPIERAVTAMGKFGKLSESEVTTPVHVAEDMIKLLPEKSLFLLKNHQNKFLDIASKMGEFAIAVCKRCEELGIAISDIADSVEAIVTSTVAYEFTRKVYKILGLNTDCIASKFTTYDLLEVKGKDGNVCLEQIQKLFTQNRKFCEIDLNDNYTESEDADKMIFNAVVGNPPYQQEDGGAGASSRPIYPEFVDIARKLSAAYASVIIPSRWYTGGKGGKEMEAFRKSMLEDVHLEELHDCLHPEEIFPDTNNRGGVCYFLWNKKYDNSVNETKVFTHDENNKVTCVKRPLKTKDLDIFIRNHAAIAILNKVFAISGTNMMSAHVSSRKPYGIESNIVKTDDWHTVTEGMASPLKCVGKGKKYGYVEAALATSHKEWIPIWKVFTPRANNVGTELNDDNLNTFVGEPNVICTEAYMVLGIGLDLDSVHAQNLAEYFHTKFARFMHSLAKTSHDATSKTYRFVPVQDFSEKWTDEKLYEKYGLTEEEIACIESSIKPM